MADAGVPWLVFLGDRVGERSEDMFPTNDSMVNRLRELNILRSEQCVAAFQAVDRGHFWRGVDGRMGTGTAYLDMPLRSGRFHISAPHMYAKALENLMPLEPGMSFLNVGSGTGYFNSLVSHLTGDLATNHGIDIWEETVAYSRQCCEALGKKHLQFSIGNVYNLDVSGTMRFDRIYLGACANSKSKYLYRLLEVGGVLIGPFQNGPESQQLRRVVRRSETRFSVEVLCSVQFTTLVEPAPPLIRERRLAARDAPSLSSRRRLGGPEGTPALAVPVQHRMARPNFEPPPRLPRSGLADGSEDRSLEAEAEPAAEADAEADIPEVDACCGLPGVAFTFALHDRLWSPERSFVFPASFLRVVRLGLLSRARDPTRLSLPAEVWVRHVLPMCGRHWFEPDGADDSADDGDSCGGSISKAQPSDEDVLTTPPDSNWTSRRSSDDSSWTSRRSSFEEDELGAAETAAAGRSSLRRQHSSLGSSRPPLRAQPLEGLLSSGASRALVEVFRDGRRHTIGAAGDPDDARETSRSVAAERRLAVPMAVLQWLALDARRRASRRRRRLREEMNATEPDEENEEVGPPEQADDLDDAMDVSEGTDVEPEPEIETLRGGGSGIIEEEDVLMTEV